MAEITNCINVAAIQAATNANIHAGMQELDRISLSQLSEAADISHRNSQVGLV